MLNGFSGHGLQHCFAAGRAGSELIDHENRYQTLDLNVFRFDRCCMSSSQDDDDDDDDDDDLRRIKKQQQPPPPIREVGIY